MRFRGVHILNHGFVKGSRKVADAIVESGVLLAGSGWDGHGVYGHFLESAHYEEFPHLVFETEIDEGQLHRIPAATGDYFVIRSQSDLTVDVIRFENLD